MTPIAPEPPESVGTPDEIPEDAATEAVASGGPSRADLQAQLRQTHKAEQKEARKEAKRKHRWRRRSIWALCTIVVLAGLGVGGIYFYAQYRYDQIKKIHSRHLVTQSADPLKPFNVLLVGSDSRAFVGNNSTLSNEIGNEGNAGGQRSDVTMVARFNPGAKTVTVLSIPRDLWVDIPGNDSGISGMNRINAAYDSGPDLLIQTIEKDLGIQINHYIAVNFPGFTDMVNALGGITMDFPTAVKDAYTGLDVTQTGCQTVNGVVALQLVRSRHLFYRNSNGYWEGDGLSDFSRIQRQDAFFRAVLAKVNASITDPFAINSFIGASVGNLTIDDTLSESELFHIAEDFRGLQSSHLVTETLPVTSFVTDGGADVLQMAQPYALSMIGAFNAIGTGPPVVPVVHTAKGGKGTPTTTTTTLPHGQVNVDVLNASSDQAGGLAGLVSSTLRLDGFTIGAVANASSPLSGTSSEILYGPAGLQSAQTVNAELRGPVTLVADPGLSGSTVQLLVAGTSLIVSTPSNPGHPGSSGTATTVPTGPTTTTTTTIPSDVYTNTQKEPWNPFPCTLGATTTASPKTPTTVKGKAKK
ncbi:MAG TPA: LCP family protein [Acidimicrobiales bacterium]|nr:LCP family protein [Acidimicrobiales bacterium]